MRNLPQIYLELKNSMSGGKCDFIERVAFIQGMENAPAEYVHIYTENKDYQYLGGTLRIGEKTETCDPIEAFLKLMSFAPLKINLPGIYFSYIVEPGEPWK